MVYLDYCATSKPFEEVLSLYEEISRDVFGNSNSNHRAGAEAQRKLQSARESILSLLGLEKTHYFVFTSGATEANNTAIKGICHKYSNRGKKIICSKGEHPSVLNAFEQMQNEGFQVVWLPLDKDGKADLNELEKAMDKDTILVSIMAVNNEVGSVNDLSKIAEIKAKFPKCLFHTDATQAVGKLKLDFAKADLISFSAHKFGGLKGNGGLAFRKNISFESLLAGGSQEMGLRGGTVDVAGSCAMAKALEMSLKEEKNSNSKYSEFNAKLRYFLENPQQFSINSPKDGIPCLLNFSLLKKKASVVVEALSGHDIFVSSVSACSSKGEPISYVLEAMGKSEGEARNSIRVSFGHETTMDDIDAFISAFGKIMDEVRDR